MVAVRLLAALAYKFAAAAAVGAEPGRLLVASFGRVVVRGRLAEVAGAVAAVAAVEVAGAGAAVEVAGVVGVAGFGVRGVAVYGAVRNLD